jgi:hypothetical protein
MWRYLSEHPDVFMTPLKEPHFFAADIDDPVVRGTALTLDWYLSLFDDAGDAKVIGDASVLYLFSKVAARGIRELSPDAKLLVMLRNPTDLVYAFHNQLIFSGQESEKDFERAWRLNGRRSGSPLLDYGAVGKLGEQLERLFGVFDRSRVQAIVFDDFRVDPAREYALLLEFLELPPDGRAAFPKVNASYRHRSELLRRLIEWLPDPTPLKRLLGIERIGFTDWLYWKNVTRHKRPPLSPEFRAEVSDFFSADVALLSDLLGRDLTHWTSPGAGLEAEEDDDPGPLVF